MEDNGRTCTDREAEDRTDPPGDFTSPELREDTARFLEELRRRAEKKKGQEPRKKPGPPPKA
jgi:hypothetical protein